MSQAANAKSIAPIALSEKNLKVLPPKVAWPTYDRRSLRCGIAHIGVGGFHRAHQAVYMDELFRQGLSTSWAIGGIGLMPRDVQMRDSLAAQDFLYTVVSRDDRQSEATVIGSIRDLLLLNDNYSGVMNYLTSADTKIVSLTVTEGGYCLDQATGGLNENDPSIIYDRANSTEPKGVWGLLYRAQELRRQSGIPPFSILSCDNLQKNGDITRRILVSYAQLVDDEMASWIEGNVSFPNSMVDRITPITTEADKASLALDFGVVDQWPVFAEPFRQWVIEDHFSNGRPEWEKVGVQFTGDVGPYEKMKIRLLNAGHSALGYLGYLCGYRYIYEIMRDEDFSRYLKAMFDQEVTPILEPVPGVDLEQYKLSLIERFSNGMIKDQALRICLDGSNKIPKFILPSIEDQLLTSGPRKRLVLTVASWFRFLEGTDEQGQAIPIEDPRAKVLIQLAKQGRENPRPLLELREVFGNLADSTQFVAELSRALESLYRLGARATLRDYLC